MIYNSFVAWASTISGTLAQWKTNASGNMWLEIGLRDFVNRPISPASTIDNDMQVSFQLYNPTIPIPDKTVCRIDNHHGGLHIHYPNGSTGTVPSGLTVGQAGSITLTYL